MGTERLGLKPGSTHLETMMLWVNLNILLHLTKFACSHHEILDTQMVNMQITWETTQGKASIKHIGQVID